MASAPSRKYLGIRAPLQGADPSGDRPLAPASLRFFTILNGMPQSRALPARRIDALGASSYLRDGTLGRRKAGEESR